LVWPRWSVDVGLVETAGGVRSPQAIDGDVVDLARLLRPDVVVLVSDAGLGAINGVRMGIEALATATGPGGRPVPVLVVLNRADPGSDLHERNRQWLVERCGLDVTPAVPAELGRLARLLARSDRISWPPAGSGASPTPDDQARPGPAARPSEPLPPATTTSVRPGGGG